MKMIDAIIGAIILFTIGWAICSLEGSAESDWHKDDEH